MFDITSYSSWLNKPSPSIGTSNAKSSAIWGAGRHPKANKLPRVGTSHRHAKGYTLIWGEGGIQITSSKLTGETQLMCCFLPDAEGLDYSNSSRSASHWSRWVGVFFPSECFTSWLEFSFIFQCVLGLTVNTDHYWNMTHVGIPKAWQINWL